MERVFSRTSQPCRKLGDDRLLVVTVFPWEDYVIRPDHLAPDTPVDDFERSVWDVYDLTTGERLSRTETPRAYVPTDRTADGVFIGYCTTRLEESVVVKLRFEPGR